MPSDSIGSLATQSSKDWSESPDQVLDPPPSPLAYRYITNQYVAPRNSSDHGRGLRRRDEVVGVVEPLDDPGPRVDDLSRPSSP